VYGQQPGSSCATKEVITLQSSDVDDAVSVTVEHVVVLVILQDWPIIAVAES
jgi:hypothetical protein